MPTIFEKVLGSVGSRITPDVVEERIPHEFKDLLTTNLVQGPIPSWEKLKATLALDALIGRTAATPIPQGRVGPTNPRGIAEQLFRPSNLVPASRASALLKARSFGPPLLRALTQEGLVAGGFSAAETARLGGNHRQIAESGVLGFGAGAVTPVGLSLPGMGLARIRGKQIAAGVPDTAPGTVSQQRKKSTRNMTDEELDEITVPRSIEEARLAIKQERESMALRIQESKERVKNPLGRRPTGAKGAKKKGPFLDDFLVVDGVEYTPAEIDAYAGVLRDRPTIAAGKHMVFKDADNKQHFVQLNIQEARALDDLMDEVDEPTIKQVKQRLEEVSKRDTGLTEAEELELPEGEVRQTKGKIATSRATLVHQYITKKAPRQKSPLPLPSSATTPQAKARIRELRRLHDERFRIEEQQAELSTRSNVDRQRVEQYDASVNPENIVRTNLQRREDTLSRDLLNIVKAREKGGPSARLIEAANKIVRQLGRVPAATTLQKRLGISRKQAIELFDALSVEGAAERRDTILKELEVIKAMLAGKIAIPDDLMAQATKKAEEAAANRPDITASRTKVAKNQEEYTALQAEVEAKNAEIAQALGGEADPRSYIDDQIRLITEQEASAAGQKPPLQPALAKQMREARIAATAEMSAKVQFELADRISNDRRLAALDKALEMGATNGRTPKARRIQKASQALERLVEAQTRRRAILKRNPKGLNTPKTASEPMLNFAKIALVEATTRARTDAAWSTTVSAAERAGLPKARARMIALRLREILTEATGQGKNGLGARAYIEIKGKKRYGTIMSVTPPATASDDIGDLIVELRPEWKASREAVAVPLRDVSLEYKGDGIENRYKLESGVMTESRLEEIDTADIDPLGMGFTITQMRLGQDIQPLQTTQAQVVTPEMLDAEVAARQAEFDSTLTPYSPALPDKSTDLERLAFEGWQMMVYGPRPRGKVAGEAWDVAVDRSLQHRRERLAELGYAIDDPDLNMLSDMSDPMQQMFILLGRSGAPNIVRGNPGDTPSGIQRALNFVNGMVFNDSRVRAINAMRISSKDTASGNVFAYFGDLENAMYKYAADDALAAGNSGVSRNGKRELEALMVQKFNPEFKSITGTTDTVTVSGMVAIKSLPDDLRAQVYDRLAREPWVLMRFPELFPGMPEKYLNISKKYNAMLEDLNISSAGVAARKASVSHSNSMMIAPEWRKYLERKEVLEKSPLHVIAELAKTARAHGKSFHEAFASGNELVQAEPFGVWNSIVDAITEKQIKALAPPGTKITTGVTGDLSHTAGRWEIRSLNKWKVLDADGKVDSIATKDLQDSLRQLETSLNGIPDWKGLTRISQAIASMVLTLDANILSVQGYAAASSKAVWEIAKLAANPTKLRPSEMAAGAKAFKAHMDSYRQVMTDEGFHAWFRTNYDEINYLTSLGLRTGMESFTAGTKLNKMPLEWLPYAGNIFRLGREFNDLQFNRWLLVMKTKAVQQQLDKVKTFRALGQTISKPFMKQPGIKEVVDEAGGEMQYLMGEPEEVVRAAIRVVNNKLGGISMDAQGIGAWRQTAEQIMSIVPGFFRAQAGMLTTSTKAFTNPKNVEGWLALTGMAEEIVFAGALATGLAYATGNEDKLNLTDMRRADWMAVPFGDSYIPIIPRVAIPRVLARTIAEGFDAASGGGFDAGPAIQSFATGRMSPMLSALGSQFFEEDFLGRRYRDRKDRAFAGITSFMPIFVENLASDAREKVAQDGWGTVTPTSPLGTLTSVASQTPLQFMGKSVVPRPPIDKLNEIAKNYSSAETPDAPDRNWNELNAEEQETLKKNPSVQAAVNDWEYYRNRRASPKEQQVEAAFKIADEQTTLLRTQPVRFRDGKVLAMRDAYDLLLAGEIDGDKYREYLGEVNIQINRTMTDLDVSLKEKGFDLNAKHEERVKRLRDIFGDDAESTVIQTQLAIWDSERITPEQFTNEVTVQTPNGEVTFAETDWDRYQEAKDAVMQRYSPVVQANAAVVQDKWHDDGVDAYRDAAESRAEIEEMPRYRGLTNPQADKLDAMTKSFRDLRDQVRAKIGLPGTIAPLPPGMGQALRVVALKSMVQTGFIKDRNAMKLATLAILMEEEPMVREVMRGPQQLQALIQNPEVIMFYPYLLSRIPVWLRGKLPSNLQPQFDVWNRYEDAA